MEYFARWKVGSTKSGGVFTSLNLLCMIGWVFCILFSLVYSLCIHLFQRKSNFGKSQVHSTNIQRGTCIVTGASSGIGKETAKKLSKLGYHVILGCRFLERGSNAMSEIKAELGDDISIQLVQLNLCSTASVFRFVKIVRGTLEKADPPRPLELLVNNAGILAATLRYTEDGIESTISSNYLGTFLLTQQLLPLLRQSGPSARIVNVASFTHWIVGSLYVDPASLMMGCTRQADGVWKPKGADYIPAHHYQASKLCILLFTYELHRRFSEQPGHGFSSIAVDPGLVDTGILRELPLWLVVIGSAVLKMLRLMQPPSAGADAVLKAVTAPQTTSGVYMFGPKGICLQSSHLSQNTELAQGLWESSVILTKQLIHKLDISRRID